MCGIYGMRAARGTPLRAPAAAAVMATALYHRGPDGRGHRAWPDAVVGVTRLRVMDLDPRADQPLSDPSGAVVLACNGEIYNADTLRRRFPDYPYRSASDVEVVLPLYLAEGSDGIAELDGMFALALLDRRTGALVLARDRAGEKPLFTARVAEEWWFASEIGALLATGAIARAPDPDALRAFLRYGYLREPRTPFPAVQKVPAGTILTVTDAGVRERRYWDPTPSVEDADADLAGLLRDAVGRQVRADVPVGVFTSGGLDSSLLARLAADRLGAHRVRTFAVGFPDPAFDERPYAQRLARQLATTCEDVLVEDDQVLDVLHALAAAGEPIGDPAAIPTLLLSRKARGSVTVVLSGEGADELFGGYPTYIGHRLAPAWIRLPGPLRSLVRQAVAHAPGPRAAVSVPFLFDRFAAAAERPWPERHQLWFASGLPASAIGDGWTDGSPPGDPDADPVAGAMRVDYAGPLRERLLVKVDRATMRASLEARAPYLDPAVTRAAFAAAGRHVHGLSTKRLLREVARPLLPPFILRRRKRGLSVPVSRWLNGPLAAVADRLLAPRRLAAQGLVDEAAVARLLAAHRAGAADHGRALWTLFVVQHWLDRWNLEIER